MNSGAGNAPGFQKGRNAIPQGQQNQGYYQHQLERPHAVAGMDKARAQAKRKYQENKAQNLMPERMHRLYSGRNNVLYELSGLPRQMFVLHDFIVSKRSACTGVASTVQSRKHLLSDEATQPMAL
jgi:hypothetical protein